MKKIVLYEENVKNAYANGCWDIKKTLSRLFPNLFDMVDVQLGDRFKNSHSDDVYLLATSHANYACLISVDTGNRWHDEVWVKTMSSITPDEWSELTHGKPKQFTKQIK